MVHPPTPSQLIHLAARRERTARRKAKRQAFLATLAKAKARIRSEVAATRILPLEERARARQERFALLARAALRKHCPDHPLISPLPRFPSRS